MNDDARVLLTAAGFGAVTGMRSLSVPALLARDGRAVRRRRNGPAARLLASPGAGVALPLLAAAELVVDKLPIVPDRIRPVPLAARALIGGLAGAAVAERAGRGRTVPALVGAATAVGSAFAAYSLRRWATRRLPVPDTAVALVEDAIVVALGRRMLADLD